MAKPIPVDAYIRVSRVGDRQGSFISPELQRASIQRVCERENLSVQETIEEFDASGGNPNREGWNYLIERVERGESRGIVCWNLSRFSRSVKDALTAIERIENAGGKLYSEEGQLGTLDRNIRLAIAQDERDRARAGFRNAVANAIARGVYISAKIPIGYVRGEDRRLVPDPMTAPIVVQLFERRAKGHSWKQLSNWLGETHGIYRPRVSIRDIIMNPAYLGWARQGDIINEKAHVPLVSKLLWDKAQKARGKKPVHTGESQRLLLRSIITCSSCGYKMLVGSTKGAKKDGVRERLPAYYCRNEVCGDPAYARAGEVDTFVTDSILAFLSSVEATIKTKTNDPKELAKAEQELEEAEYALQQFKANKKAITILGLDAWNELLEEYVVTRDVAQLHRDSLKDENPIDEFNLVPELWKEWTNESRREFLQKVIGACSITPAHRQKLPISERIELGLNLTGTEMELTTHSIVTRQKPAAVVWSQE